VKKTLLFLKKDLRKFAKPSKAKILQRFFKTGPGEYAEGDIFLGLKTDETKSVAKKYEDLSLPELKKLLLSKIHEERVTAVMILNRRFLRADPKKKKVIYQFYLENISGINNWDLVDGSAPVIIGGYLDVSGDSRKILYRFAVSNSLWERRIGMMATFFFIKKNKYEDAFKIAKILLEDNEDLIHKAVGWMLREIGKRKQEQEEKFLKKYYQKMPRTMLRYAIEKFPEAKRQAYLKSKVTPGNKD